MPKLTNATLTRAPSLDGKGLNSPEAAVGLDQDHPLPAQTGLPEDCEIPLFIGLMKEKQEREAPQMNQ